MELKGKKINFLGDSITEGVGASEEQFMYPNVIAAECGFSSQSYFNYAFRRAEKMTPKNYRSIKNNEYHSGSTENAEFQYSSV